MIDFLLDHFIIIVVLSLGLWKFIEIKKEYFPKEMRYYEDTFDRYMYLKITRRYRRAYIRDISPIKNFNFYER